MFMCFSNRSSVVNLDLFWKQVFSYTTSLIFPIHKSHEIHFIRLTPAFQKYVTDFQDRLLRCRQSVDLLLWSKYGKNTSS
jgi:hypothetical protein